MKHCLLKHCVFVLTMRGSGCNSGVFTLSLDLSRNQLYLGGGFTTAGGQPTNRTAKYNLTSGQYSALGIGKCDLVVHSSDASVFLICLYFFC